MIYTRRCVSTEDAAVGRQGDALAAYEDAVMAIRISAIADALCASLTFPFDEGATLIVLSRDNDLELFGLEIAAFRGRIAALAADTDRKTSNPMLCRRIVKIAGVTNIRYDHDPKSIDGDHFARLGNGDDGHAIRVGVDAFSILPLDSAFARFFREALRRPFTAGLR